MKKCCKCGVSMDDDALFCTSCGTKQEEGLHCIHCGALIDVDSIFCTSCGGRQDAVQQPVQQPQQVVAVQSEVESSSQETIEVDDDEKRKQYIYIACAVLAVLLCIGGWFAYQKMGQTNDNQAVEGTEYAPLSVLYRGKVDKYPITMELDYEYGNTGEPTGAISGSYYYDKQGADKRLTLSGFNRDGKIELFETDETGRQTGHFVGLEVSGDIEGEFINAQGKSMHFKVIQSSGDE